MGHILRVLIKEEALSNHYGINIHYSTNLVTKKFLKLVMTIKVNWVVCSVVYCNIRDFSL